MAQVAEGGWWRGLADVVAREALLGPDMALMSVAMHEKVPLQLLLAGESPRLVVHVWDQDSEAGEALLGRLYELWEAGGVDAGEALKRAQLFVAGHDEWRNPYYWAGWQLWSWGD